MGGTVRGKIECYHYQDGGGDAGRITQEMFKNLFDFFSAHPTKYTIIASQYNSGGTDYWDGASPFIDRAWFVVKFLPSVSRTVPWYLMVQYSVRNSSVDTGVSAPCRIFGQASDTSNHRLAFVAAVGVGGDYNCWNGTTNANGTDTKGNPVWKTPAGGTGVYVLNRSCAAGGTYVTKKEDMFGVTMYYATVPVSRRSQILADDDNFLFINDAGSAFDYISFGPYTLRSGLAFGYPMVGIQMSEQLYGEYASYYGQPASGSTRPGGIAPVVGGDTKSFYLDWFTTMIAQTDLHPNKQFAPPAYDLAPFLLGIRDSPYYGMVGFLDFIRLVYNVPNYDTSTDKSIAFMGTGSASKKLAIPWDGVTTPGSGLTRAGVNF